MKMIDLLKNRSREHRIARSKARAALTMRDLGYTYYGISQALGMSLSDVRRALDPRAAALHRKWRR
jgi:DNA-directed RNA polymerase specialized sigma24 family protein